MVPSIDETGLNELKRLYLNSLNGLECIIDTTHQQDVPSTAFSNLVDLSLELCDGLREICGGGRPPRGFLENLETLKVSLCSSMSSLFPSWVLIQRLQKLKKVNVDGCCELEDVFQLEGLCYVKQNPFLLSSLESLYLENLENLRYIWKGPTQQVSLQSLTVVQVKWCNKLRYLFTLSLARSLLQLEELTVSDCYSLEYIVSIKEAEENVGGGGGNDVMFPKLRKLKLDRVENFINFYSENSSLDMQTAKKVLELESLKELECLCKGPTHLISLPNLKKLSVSHCNRLRHMFSPSLARNLLQLEEMIIYDCGELEYIVSIKEAEENVGGGGGNDVMLPKLRILQLDRVENFIDFYSENSSLNLQTAKRVLELYWLRELECLCKGPTHLLSLPNLKKLSVYDCDRLTHLFTSTLARNLLQLESICIMGCKELEQIIVKDHTEDDHVQLGLFPNLSSISVKRCGKLKTLFPAVTIARSGLQKLRTLNVESSSQLEEMFGHKDEADMTSHREMVLPQLEKLTLRDLASLVNFCPIGYHFIFPSLSELVVTKCPMITTKFSLDQNRSVHTEAEVLTNFDVVVTDM
ncbi:hypothetical protein LWI28_025932 [Acer negundo]|uniref:Disease resistance protein At4g27190-like leucine-rich repeats domain-containing protein n=1 Tax=Acer negundo TaxID=4023 RepID=A0AAD5NZ80_ACENE|nr:hypothetical protein LWI28_025932 [Acer negundo]